MHEYKETKDDYDQGVDWHIQKSLSYNWNSQIDKFIRMIRGKRVLDVGCGGGRDIAEFLKRGLQAEGLDYSVKTIKKCQKEFPQTIFYESDMRKMNLPNKRYDGLWACASLLNIKKSEVHFVLSEFKKVLKKDGELFISVKKGEGEGLITDKAGKRFFSFYSINELKTLVQQAGFKVTNIELVSDDDLTGKNTKSTTTEWVCLYAVNL